MRGLSISLDAKQRVERALAGLTWPYVQYSMVAGKNGGTNPTNADCASVWEDGKGATYHTSDCVGFALWACGLDRYQPLRFPLYGGWINTDSLVDAASQNLAWNGGQLAINGLSPKVDGTVLTGLAGCVIVYPGYRRLLRRVPGHIGVIVDNKGTVIHCHGPAMKGPAISKGHVSQWLGHKGVRILWINTPK